MQLPSLPITRRAAAHPMSLLTAPLASLFFFSGVAVAQVSAPDCSLAWKWSFNSLGQNACTVAAYMMATCNGGAFNIDALQPGYQYIGPSGVDDSNLCKCSTVGYSLLSACGGCQGATWLTWSEYTFNCTRTLPPSSFPNPVPAGTRVPHWALLDVTNENLWDYNKSYAAGDTPELGPGTILGQSNSSDSSNSKHSSNAGAIAGGVVGGIAVISILVVAVVFLLRRNSRPSSAASAGDGTVNLHKDQVLRPMSDPGTITTSSHETASLMKTYNPDDPTTFPWNQGTPNSPYFPTQMPSLSSSRNLYTVAAMPSPRSQRYHGLPMV